MCLTFLGTGSGTPTRTRNTAATIYARPDRSEFWLFDCGEATQHQMLRHGINMNKVSRVFITHMHGDHTFGLPGFISSRAFRTPGDPLTIYGPPGIAEFVSVTLNTSASHIRYPLEVVELDHAGEVPLSQDDTVTVRYTTLDHGVQSYAYRITEADQPGELQVDKLIDHGVQPGPRYGQLKRGEDITLDNGTVLRSADFVGPPQPGPDIVLFGDTRFVPGHADFAAGADLMVHEATYGPEYPDKAQKYFHSTTTQAAELARQARVKKLVLTHFSARYDTDEKLAELLAGAQAIFPHTVLAADGATIGL